VLHIKSHKNNKKAYIVASAQAFHPSAHPSQ